MSRHGSSKGDEYDTSVMKAFREGLLRSSVFTFAHVKDVQAEKLFDWIEDGDVIQTFLKTIWIYEYMFSTLEDYK